MSATVSSPWIISRGWDLALFILTPLLVVATLIPLAAHFPAATFGAFLLAFFTFGHHLPGFLRAYGDRDLFRQYRLHFVMAPLVIFPIAWWCARRDLHGLLFLVFTWDIWHVLMQQYGFLRIYDAKSGRVDRAGAWADRAVALSWYLTLIALSPHYTHDLLWRGYSSGLPSLSPATLSLIRYAMVSVSAVLTLAYAMRHIVAWRRGERLNGRKLLALATFLWATWYLYVVYPDFIVGFAVWSAFHCIQYYGIVWAFNRNRVSKAASAGAFLRFLFRPRASLIALYCVLILAYGGINWIGRYMPAGTGLELLMAFVVTSGTLHYYYDGFIWRVRDQGTQRPLAIAEVPGATTRGRLRQPAYTQAAVAALVLGVLAIVEFRAPFDETRVRKQIAESAPDLQVAQRNYADSLRREGRYQDALAVYERAVALDDRDAAAAQGYGLTLAALGRHDAAISALEQALARDPGLRSAHYNLGSLLVRRGDTLRALQHYREAFPAGDERAIREVEKDPAAAEVLTNLALGLLQSGQRSEALDMLRRVVNLDHRSAPAHLNLGSLLVMAGDLAGAKAHYRNAAEYGDAGVRAAAQGALAKLP